MNEAIYSATSGALVNQMRLEILSNNLSNINTVGFKEDRSSFKSYLPGFQDVFGGGPKEVFKSKDITNFQVAFEGTKTDLSPGELKYTGNSLDMALDGKGFFSVKTTDGIQYTRKGDFTLNDEGFLVTQEGLPVLGEGGKIKISGQEISVDSEGNLSVDGTRLDALKIVDFPKPNSLRKVGNTLFVPVNHTITGNRAKDVKVQEGFIELSNVNAIRLMTEMIELLRGYESYQKVIRSIDSVTSTAINEVGKVE